MLVPNRHSPDLSRDYRYGFQGQEKDDEISGEGNSYTAEFWQYDPRIARRWNIDPIDKAFESPYSTFKNNPLSFIDPRGLNGDVTIDKKEKKITVTGKYYYNENDDNLNKLAITKDYKDKRGEVHESLISQLKIDDQTFTDVDGQEWTVSYNIQFIAKSSQEEVDKALSLDPTANQILFKSTKTHYRAAASWSFKERSINVYGLTSTDSFKHEMFHGFGLPHAVFIPGSPEGIFGTMEDYSLEDVNGLGRYFGPLMSYASEKTLEGYELKYMLQNALNLSKKVERNIVNVHLSGFVYKNVTKEQMEKQFPDDRKKHIEEYLKLQENNKDEIISK